MQGRGNRLDGVPVVPFQKVIDITAPFTRFFKYLSWVLCGAYLMAQITLPFFTVGWPLTLLTLTLCLSSALFVLIDLYYFYPLDAHKTAKINIFYYGVSLFTLLFSILLACTYLPIALIPTFLILPHLVSIQILLGLLVNLFPQGIMLLFSMQLIDDLLPPLSKTSVPRGLCHVALPTWCKRALAHFHLQSIILSLNKMHPTQMLSSGSTDLEISKLDKKAITDWYQYIDDAKLSAGMPQTTHISSSTHAVRQEGGINTLANLNADGYEANVEKGQTKLSTARAESILKVIMPDETISNTEKFNRLNALAQDIFRKMFPDFCQKLQDESTRYKRPNQLSLVLPPRTPTRSSKDTEAQTQAAKAAEARAAAS
jgi:hypothetical protein